MIAGRWRNVFFSNVAADEIPMLLQIIPLPLWDWLCFCPQVLWGSGLKERNKALPGGWICRISYYWGIRSSPRRFSMLQRSFIRGKRNSSLRWCSLKHQLSLFGGYKCYIFLGNLVGVFNEYVHYWLEMRCWECFTCMKRNSRCLSLQFGQEASSKRIEVEVTSIPPLPRVLRACRLLTR